MTEVERPAINRDEGTTLAFSKQDARKLLDLPTLESVEGLRDRAILSVGLQVGMRRAEIAATAAARGALSEGRSGRRDGQFRSNKGMLLLT